MKKLPFLLTLSLISFALVSGCQRSKREEIDISSLHTNSAVTETMAPDLKTVVLESVSSEDATSGTKESAASASGTSTKINTYKSGKISIEYPEIVATGNTSNENAVNSLIKNNALSVIAAYKADETKDTLEITCRIITADRKNLTVLYTGLFEGNEAAYPLNLFYTNTIDLSKASNIRLSNHADPYTLAGYVLSGDCQFSDVTSTRLTELLKIKNNTSLDSYTSMFTHADFPLDGEAFPSSFSYEKQGTVYFSIPVTHALGDYAIIKYSPDTK